MLPESGCCLALGFAGSMQTTQELSPRSAEPAVLDTVLAGSGAGEPGLGERDSLWERDSVRGRTSPADPPAPGPVPGDAVLRTLQGLTMTVKQEDAEDSVATAPSSAAAAAAQSASSPQRLADSPASSRPLSASSRSSPSVTMDRLSPAMTQPQQTYHQQQLQLRQIHQRIKEQQQQLQQQQQQLQPQQRETYRGTESGRGRGRRRSRWKLKFHHQALPPEYLDHYEASLAGGGAGRGGRDSGDDKARVIGSRAPRNPDRNKRPAPAASSAAAEPASAPAPAATAAPVLPPLAPKPANGADAESAFPAAPLPIPVPMPFGLEVLTRYQALLGQGKTDLDPAAFVAGNLMSIMAQPSAGAAAAASPEQDSQANGQRALLSSLLGAASAAASASAAAAGRREPLDVCRVLPPAAGPASKVMTFQDLPYMGEMTLDNMKPRRGRKPKKADICHLIYKNYGTVFPRDAEEEAVAAPAPAAVPAPAHLPVRVAPVPPAVALPPRLSRSDVQSRIISSLLEKRLTQEEQAQAALGLGAALGAARPAGAGTGAEEPLNLCVRDHNPLKIKLLRRHGNFYESNGSAGAAASAASPAGVKSEPASPESEVIEVDADPSLVNQEDDDEENEEEDEDDDADGKPGADEAYSAQNMLYWGGAGGAGGAQAHPMYVHPLLYAKGFPPLPAGMAQLQVMPPLPPLPPLLRLPGLEDESIAVPSLMAAPPSRAARLDKQQQQQHSPSRPSSRSGRSSAGGGKGRAAASSSSSPAASPAPSPGPAPSPPKRKRSAIFIPPVPPESSNNPTTEVSICKFKFTGGAKPSLQEKKMLSVDAGGNFRYYSGTGDKSMRGYEFFPRESMQQQQQQQLQLQQQQLLPKPYPAQTPPQQENLRTLLFQNVMESLHMPQQGLLGFPPQQVRVPRAGAAPAAVWDVDPDAMQQMQQQMQQNHRHLEQQQHLNAGRKRKTRKSMEREKLEKTFKEKGFLIQTQQLESAEGATYCKFRQLRKFTRYLFRSWKDYLPGGVREVEDGLSQRSPGPRPGPVLVDEQVTPAYSLALEDADADADADDVDGDLL